MTNPNNVIDADGHICEPELIWTEYTEEKYRKDVIQVQTIDGVSHIAIEGKLRRSAPGTGPAAACIPGGMDPGKALTWDDIFPGSYDAAARLNVMDDEGLHRALLFPSVHLLWGDVQNPKVAAETCRAYNNWLSDFCGVNDQRLFGMGIVPLQDVGLALTEVSRLKDLGLSGFILRPERFGDLALYDSRCDVLWQTAVEQGLSVGIHGSFGTQMPGFSTGRYDDNLFFEHMVAHPFGQMAVVMDLLAGGVMDRFPKLQVGFFESGLGWIPYWLDRLDEHFEVMGHHTPWLKRRPSEIFSSQCFVSMEADEAKGLQWLMEKDLGHCVLWGSDYPHFDSTYPGAYAEAQASFELVGNTGAVDVAEQVVVANPSRFLRL